MRQSTLPGLGRQTFQRGLRPGSVGSQLRTLASDARDRYRLNRGLETVRQDDESRTSIESESTPTRKGNSGGLTRAERRKQAKKIRFLSSFPCFRGFTEEQLNFILKHSKRRELSAGETLFRQGSPGREYFFLERGDATTRQDDSATDQEKTDACVVLSSPNVIEPEQDRKYTLEAGESGLAVFRVTKDDYNRIRDLNQDLVIERALAVISKIQPFCNLERNDLIELAAKMKPEHFSPGTYICEQGAVGHTFYIIMSGLCIVTINQIDVASGRKKELKVNEMEGDGFFGEVALMDKNERRTANVICYDDVSVLSLRRAVFEELMEKHMNAEHKANFMKAVAVRNLKSYNSKRQLVGRTKWESFPDQWDAAERLPGKNGQRPSKFLVIARRMRLTFDYSVYRKCWQDMAKLFSRGSVDQLKHYGETAAIISRIKTKGTAVKRLRDKLFESLAVDAADRTEEQMAVTYACMLPILKDEKDGILKRWENHHFIDLCTAMRAQQYAAGRLIFDTADTIDELFLVMRGTVLVYDATGGSGRKTTRGFFRAIVRPGQVFGANTLSAEGLMKSSSLRQKRKVRAYALSKVDVVAWSARKFDSILRAAKTDLSYDEKVNFIETIPLFSGSSEINKLAAIAQLIQTEEARRGNVLLDAGEISEKLCFIVDGSVEVLVEDASALPKIHGGSSSSPTRAWTKVTTLGPGEYFGESGVLSTMGNQKEYFESTRIVAAGGDLCYLVLDKSHYQHLPKSSLRRIRENFSVRSAWRGARLLETQRVKKAMIAEAHVGPVVSPIIVKAASTSGDDGRVKKASVGIKRGPKLKKVVPPSIEVLKADKAAAARDSNARLLSYQQEIGGITHMSAISISEPSLRTRPSHWFGAGYEEQARKKKGKINRRKQKLALSPEKLALPLSTTGPKTLKTKPPPSSRDVSSKERSLSRGPVVSLW